MHALRARSLICFWLAASLGHLPLPWGHDHANLDPVVLAAHWQSRLAVATASRDASNWHWHFFVPGSPPPNKDCEGKPQSQRGAPMPLQDGETLASTKTVEGLFNEKLAATPGDIASPYTIAARQPDPCRATAGSRGTYGATYANARSRRNVLSVRLL